MSYKQIILNVIREMPDGASFEEILNELRLLQSRDGGKSLSPEEQMARTRARLHVLKELCAANAFASIPDPLQWQREIRWDRDLPERQS